ncbi:MAG: 1-acyl-sn-glycerol-3-phosphate acyltransferase [Mycobacterium sp.]|jgi:1-acyl-sn-glycerol-3-phosphate acyltransferase|nr:1-acyl-sn-glycerol-3-phosphate acyltransferase [Mycobacterium sp.]MCW2743921.1 1-acyl-sn-glycerol-3-phosphate acyltransferase [Mycobacterium sp.]
MFYWFVRAVLRWPFHVLWHARLVGAGNIPATGGAVLASNHLSMCDSLFLPVLMRRRMTFLAKEEYFTGRGLKGRAKAAFVRGTGLVPLRRDDPTSAAATLVTAVERLRGGTLIGIYPEGTRSRSGVLQPGKTGVARLALTAGVPVVPIAMVGTDTVLPIGATRPHLARVTVRIGAPLTFPDADPNDPDDLRSVTDTIMAAIRELLEEPADEKLPLGDRPTTEGVRHRA